MTDYQSATREQIRLVQQGLLKAGQLRFKYPDREESIRRREKPYEKMLEALYVRDLPLATIADESDLLIHVKGPGASAPTPKVSILTKMLAGTRDQVTKLAKQLAHIESSRVPPGLDMNFVGLARGSLVIGFAVADGADAQLTRRAVGALGEASVLVSQNKSLEEVVRVFDEPAERDIAVAAIRHLSPSNRSQIDEIELLGKSVKAPVRLTTDTRRHATSLMTQPAKVATKARREFVGTIRELDLDEKRFMLRNIDGYSHEIRCAHELDEADAQKLMNRRMRVRGIAELSKSGQVSLLWVDEFEDVDD
jgi:hypothetical protein